MGVILFLRVFVDYFSGAIGIFAVFLLRPVLNFGVFVDNLFATQIRCDGVCAQVVYQSCGQFAVVLSVQLLRLV
jgi:anti-sigma factor RsiW